MSVLRGKASAAFAFSLSFVAVAILSLFATANTLAQTATRAEMAALRLNPKNATGGTNLYSQNFGWSTNLVSLPGRSGMDLNIGMSYNSLVWIKDAAHGEINFDPDLSQAGPGFRFGFPVIEPSYYDSAKGADIYLMVLPDGTRREFRRLNSTSTYYYSADSTYVQLRFLSSRGTTFLYVTDTDGTNTWYYQKGLVFQPTQIQDRNGNLITMTYDTNNRLATITDTLGRVLTVNRDTGGYPTSLTQTWKDDNGAGSNVTHTWATFTYADATVNTDFSGVTSTGPVNTAYVKVLEKITYADGRSTKFDYNGYIQVKTVTNIAADSPTHILNYITTNLDSPSSGQTDCPRLTQTRTKTEGFNLNVSGVPQEVVVTNTLTTGASYSLPGSLSGTATRIDVAMYSHPNGHYSRIFVADSGYKEGLPLATEDCTGTNCANRLRWTWNDWTQDNTSLSYPANPRVVDSRVGDATNIKKTTIDYGSNGFGLPEKVQIADGSTGTVYKTQTTSYNLSSTYQSVRVIGLPSEVKLYEGTDTSGTLMSRVTYGYDEGNYSGTDPVQAITPVQHNSSTYSQYAVAGRANLTSVTRWDVVNTANSVTTNFKYNTAGSLVSKTDPLSRTIKIGYTDNFNSTPGVSTHAYPTVVTDQAGTSLGDTNHSSFIKYRYDIGANIEATSPAPANQTYGKTTKRMFDSVGRLERSSVYVNTTEKAYTRYEYPTNGIQSKSFTPIVDVDGDGNIAEDEVLTESWHDGAGRVLRTRTEHPGSTGGWSAVLTVYDNLGRAYAKSVPTEVSVSGTTWTPAGDDATRGYIFNYSFHDWKGRVIRSVPSDSNGFDSKDTLISYAGCGCAGGQVTTVQGPSAPIPGTSSNARRTQKTYEDVLGRSTKLESYEWDGSTVYATVVNTYNGRDQVTNTRKYAGTTSSGTYQDTAMTFDGYGRLSSSHLPRQDVSTGTTYTYNADDSVATVADARQATKQFTYDSRGMVTDIIWAVPTGSGISVPANVEFLYDNAGNRTAMADGFGTVTYSYNSLSQLTAETRNFNYTVPSAPLSNNGFSIQYAYEVSGRVASLTDPYGEVINYNNDKVGRLTTLSEVRGSTTYNRESGMTYRAWGGLKHKDFNDSLQYIEYTYDNALRPAEYKFAVTGGSNLNYLSFQYATDGKLKFSSPSTNSIFDRSYEYDHLNRLVAAKTGNEARGNTETNPGNRPYRETFQYNAFNEVTELTRLNWKATFGSTFSFSGARQTSVTDTQDIPGWTVQTTGTTSSFDADGRDIDHMTYDADGRVASNTQVPTETLYEGYERWEWASEGFGYDGDGNLVSRSRTGQQCTPGTCYGTNTRKYTVMRSTVLGKNLTEVQDWANGGLVTQERYIYSFGQRVVTRTIVNPGPQYSSDRTMLVSTDPSNAVLTSTYQDWVANGASTNQIDPLNAAVGLSDTYPAPPEGGWPDPNDPNCTWNDYDDFDCDMTGSGYDDPDDRQSALGSVMGNTYYLNGFETNAHDAEHLISTGAAAVHSTTGLAGNLVQNPIIRRRYVDTIGQHLDKDPNVIYVHTDIKAVDEIVGWETEVVSTVADHEFNSGGVTYVVGQDCVDALNVAQKNLRQLSQAFDNLQRIAAIATPKGLGAGWFMAIGIRESGAGDFMKESGGKGRGWYQIDLGEHKTVTEKQAMDFEWATNWVADSLLGSAKMVSNYEASDRKRSRNPGLTYTSDQRAAMMFRIYNRGPVSESQRDRLARTDDVSTLDPGTANDDYVSNVVNLHAHCIAGARVKGRGF